MMNLKLSIVILLILPTLSGKMISITNHVSKLKSIFGDLRSQWNFDGFTIITDSKKPKRQIALIQTSIIKHVSSDYASVLGNPKVSLRKYETKNPTKKKGTCTCGCGKGPYTLNCVSTSLATSHYKPFLYIVSFDGNSGMQFEQKLSNLARLYYFFMPLQGTIKLLLINVGFKRADKFYRQLLYRMSLDFEILEILICRSKKVKYKMFTANTFNNQYRIRTWKSGYKWFANNNKNLHRTQLRVVSRLAIPYNQYLKFKHKFSKLTKQKQHLYLAVAFTLHPLTTVVQQLNATSVFIGRNVRTWDMKYPTLGSPEAALQYRYAKPYCFSSNYMINPILYNDPVEYYDFGNVLHKWLTLSLLVIIISIFTWWLKCDRRTLAPELILGMVFGIGNPRKPVGLAETLMFYSVVAVGIFFGSDLVSGLTDNTMTSKTEKTLVSWQDLTKNNITALLTYLPKKCTCSYDSSEITNSKVKYKDFRKFDHFCAMFIYKNVSVSSVPLRSVNLRVPEKIVVNNQLYARYSNILEHLYTEYWLLENLAFGLLDVISDIHWRFVECGLPKYPKLYYQDEKLIYHHTILSMTKLATLDEESDSMKNLKVRELLLYFALIGTVPFLLLLIELAIKQFDRWTRAVKMCKNEMVNKCCFTCECVKR